MIIAVNFFLIDVRSYSASTVTGMSVQRVMDVWPSVLLCCAFARIVWGGEARLPELPFSKARLIEEIDCGAEAGENFVEFPSKVSVMESTMGKPARILPNPNDAGARYFAYRIGKGKNLLGGRAYVLEIDFADNAPRTFFIRNGGEAITRGVCTGTDVGDAIKPLYVSANPESLNLPVSNSWITWTSYFFLHDRYYGLGGWPRGNDKARPEMRPADGFWVVIGQMDHMQAPLSQGAAISRIRLLEAPPETGMAVKIRFPDPLPRRYLFWREEMSDSVVAGKEKETWQTDDRLSWYENKARRMRFLGVNAYAIDLLEFGSNQGWDSEPGGGNDWYYQTPYPGTWERILEIVRRYDFVALPYYEYHGSIGAKGLGSQKRAKPLNEKLEAYTHITWTEKARANLLDIETEKDLQKLFDLTIVRFKDKAKFLGAWLRPRPSGMPISFSDSDIALFASEANEGKPVARDDLQGGSPAYKRYLEWWYRKRRDFLVKAQTYLASSGMGEDIKIFFTTDASEAGFDYAEGISRLVAEDGALWKSAGLESMTPEEALQKERHRKALTLPTRTWGEWEWQHSIPTNDPLNYKEVKNVALTYTFNRLYTVSDPALLQEFTGKAGLAIVRHFTLNEHMIAADKKPLIGYFVADFERAGPYCMMSEAVALANGDPHYIGYLAGERYAPGFSQYVRAFNQAFLALPALPSERLSDASSDKAVVVRRIDTSNGIYYAIVNTARTDRKATVQLPSGNVVDAATGEEISAEGKSVTLSMYPFQLRALYCPLVK